MNEMKKQKLKFPFASVLLWLYAAADLLYSTEFFDYPISWVRWSSWALWGVLIVLGVFSLMNKPLFVLGGTGALVLLELYHLVAGFSIYNILSFLKFALLCLAVAAITLPQLGSAKALVKKFFYLPSALFVVLSVVSYVFWTLDLVEELNEEARSYYYSYHHYDFWEEFPWVNLLFEVLLAAAFLFLILRLIDPYAKEKPVVAPTAPAAPAASAAFSAERPSNAAPLPGVEEVHTSLIAHFFLLMFTFGVWNYIWIYRTTKFLNVSPVGKQYVPVKKLLLCMFIPFYQIFWYYKHGEKLEALLRARGIFSDNTKDLYLILGIFSPMLLCFMMQDKYNQLYLSSNQ